MASRHHAHFHCQPWPKADSDHIVSTRAQVSHFVEYDEYRCARRVAVVFVDVERGSDVVVSKTERVFRAVQDGSTPGMNCPIKVCWHPGQRCSITNSGVGCVAELLENRCDSTDCCFGNIFRNGSYQSWYQGQFTSGHVESRVYPPFFPKLYDMKLDVPGATILAHSLSW